MIQSVDIKICGITNAADARLALDAGADYIGFVLYPPSPRGITFERLKELVSELPGDAPAVGVFVNASPATVRAVAGECGLAVAQIHGDEDPDGFDALPVRIWRAVKVREAAVVPAPASWPAERYVVDAAVPGLYGGTGVAADWEQARTLALEAPVMLAGGLTPTNVAQAIRAVGPRGVDVASGVEREPGRKDPDAVRAFVRAAREAMNGTN